jgi:hypothetical protein
LTTDEAEQALRIVRQIRDAQAGLTELQRLIERTRAIHGTSVAASMLYRYQAALGRAAYQARCLGMPRSYLAG